MRWLGGSLDNSNYRQIATPIVRSGSYFLPSGCVSTKNFSIQGLLVFKIMVEEYGVIKKQLVSITFSIGQSVPF